MIGRVSLLVSLLIAPLAHAEPINTPSCRRNLAMAGRLEERIAQRENGAKPGDIMGLCRLLLKNLPEMITARNAMDRCLTGDEHSAKVGHMDASIKNIRYAIRTRCSR
jgi:hypothetical protein